VDVIRRSEGLLTALSSVRVLAVPVVMALVLADRGGGLDAVAAGLFAVAAVTDTLDGYLARRWSLESTLGSFLDTTADKLLTSGTLVALVSVGRASAWVATIIIGRELLIMGLRGLVAADGVVMKPSIWGKLKTNTQFAAILLAIVGPAAELGPMHLYDWGLVLAALITVASAVEYLVRFSGTLTRAASGTET
jgi:CDP-diacylglycerol--glycerol-3-phosphate 3-phosphatidyltransferase